MKEERALQQPADRSCYYLLYLFSLGLAAGILIVNFMYDAWITGGTLLDADMLAGLRNSVQDGGGLFGYVVRHRLFAVCMLGLLSTTVIGIPFLYGYIGYLGLSAGCVLSVAIIRYGIRGLLLAAAGVLPQGLVIVPAYAALFLWGIRVNRTLYSKNPYAEYYGKSRQFYLKKGLQFAGIAAVVIIGCLLESYVNPKLLRLALQLF